MGEYKVNRVCMAKLLIYTLSFIEGNQAVNAINLFLPLLTKTNVQSMAMAAIKHGAIHVLINCAAN